MREHIIMPYRVSYLLNDRVQSVIKSNTYLLLSTIKVLNTLFAEAGHCTLVTRAVGRITTTHPNRTDVGKRFIPAPLLRHHRNRPKLPIAIESQRMPWRITRGRLLAIPKLRIKQDVETTVSITINNKNNKRKSLPGTCDDAPLLRDSPRSNALEP